MSIILKKYSYFILQVTLLLAILFLLRGHDHPGGGFIAALIASTGIGCYLIAHQEMPWFFMHQQARCIAIGCFCLLLSMSMSLIAQKPLLTGTWIQFSLFGTSIKLGTILLFDAGVFFAILGSIVWIMTILEKQIE